MVVVLDTSLKVTMNAKIIGSGTETIILAHGFGGDQSIWDKMIPSLAQRYRVVVFDWSFSGAAKDLNDFDLDKCSSFEAFADDLISLLVEMKLSSCVFVGHSMSGMVGCLASIKRPDLFNKLILVGASPRYLNDEDYEGGFELSQIQEIFVNIESNFQVWAAFFASLVVDVNDPISVEQFKGSLCRMRPDIALLLAKTLFLSDFRGSLEKIEVPCTIVQVTNDIVVPNSVVDYMQKKIKGKARVEMIKGDGHFPQLTNTTELIDVIDRIMRADSQGENDVNYHDTSENLIV